VTGLRLRNVRTGAVSTLSCGALFVAIGWFLLNLHLDYFNGALSTHPWILAENIDAVILFTAAATIAWPAALFALSGIAEKNSIILFLRKELSVLD